MGIVCVCVCSHGMWASIIDDLSTKQVLFITISKSSSILWHCEHQIYYEHLGAVLVSHDS